MYHRLLYNFFLVLLFFSSTSQSADPSYYTCNENSSSQLSKSIDALLPKLVSGTTQNGYIATSYGTENSSRIYGLAQCRGDVSKSDCSSCIKDAVANARQLCPNQADVTIWYDYCFLRYRPDNFFGQVDTLGIYFYNVENVTEPAQEFNKELGALLDQITDEAVKVPRNKGLGKGTSDLSPLVTLYALVQCHRDLSPINCAQCLAVGIENLSRICQDKKGCRVLYGSCYIRYELYPFFFPLGSQESLSTDSNSKVNELIKVYTP